MRSQQQHSTLSMFNSSSSSPFARGFFNGGKVNNKSIDNLKGQEIEELETTGRLVLSCLGPLSLFGKTQIQTRLEELAHMKR